MRDKQLLHVNQAAAELGVPNHTVRRAIHAGELEAVRLGPPGRYRVPREALNDFLQPAATSEGRPACLRDS